MSRLFLGNIPHSADETEICQWLQAYGYTVDSVEIIRDRMTGGRRGFCFASLGDPGQADHAVATLKGRLMRGRVITVNYAVPLNVGADELQRRRVA